MAEPSSPLSPVAQILVDDSDFIEEEFNIHEDGNKQLERSYRSQASAKADEERQKSMKESLKMDRRFTLAALEIDPPVVTRATSPPQVTGIISQVIPTGGKAKAKTGKARTGSPTMKSSMRSSMKSSSGKDRDSLWATSPAPKPFTSQTGSPSVVPLERIVLPSNAKSTKPDIGRAKSRVEAVSGHSLQRGKARGSLYEEQEVEAIPLSPEEIMLRQRYFDDFTRGDSDLQRKLRRSAQILAKHHDEPEVIEFLTAEHDLRRFRTEIQRQVGRIDTAAAHTVKEISNLVTDKRSNQAGGGGGMLNEEQFLEHVGHLGPALQEMTTEERISECRAIVLRGAPDLSDETKFVAHVTVFASPFATIDAACAGLQKLVVELYSSCQEICENIAPEKGQYLSHTIDIIRRSMASQLVFVDNVHEKTQRVRREFEDLESLVEGNVAAKKAAIRVGREFQKENETLRNQLYRTTVRGGEERVSKALSGDVDKEATFRYFVMMQAENVHTLRLSKPKLVSEALMLSQTLVESLCEDFNGRRVNYNSQAETMECFDHATNRKFPPENYFLDFATAGQAVEFAYKFQVSLLKVRWPEKLVELDDFEEVENPDHPQQALWKGLRFRACLHVGTPIVTNPLAANNNAANVPYFGGTAVEKLSSLLSRIRGGEVVATAKITDLFNAERFKEPNLALGITLTERPATALVQSALDQKEKLYHLGSTMLAPRRRPEEQYAFHPAYQCVFPASTFWREVEGQDDLRIEFEDDDFHSQEVRMNAFQYEELMAATKTEIEEVKEKLSKSEDANHYLMLAIQGNREELAKERAAHKMTKNLLEKSKPRCSLYKNLLPKANQATMEAEDTAALHLEQATAEIKALTKTIDALHTMESDRLEELANLEFNDACCGEDQPLHPRYYRFLNPDAQDWSDEESDPGSPTKGEQSMRSYDGKGNKKTTDCANCTSKQQKMFNLHELVKVTQTSIGTLLVGSADQVRLQQQFQFAAGVLLNDDEAAADATFQGMLDAAAEDPAPGLIPLSFCGHVGKMVNHIKHYELLREVGRRRKARVRKAAGLDGEEGEGEPMSVDEYVDELDFLAAEGEKYKKDLEALEVRCKFERNYLNSKIERLEGDTSGQNERVGYLEKELTLRTETLTLKIQETSAKATKFYGETCRLVKQLHEQRDANEETKKIKTQFLELANMVDLQQDGDQVNKLLVQEAHELEEAKEELEHRLSARDQMFKEQERMVIDMKKLQADALKEQEYRLKEEAEEKKTAAVAEALREQKNQFETKISQLNEEERKRDKKKYLTFKEKEEMLRHRQEKEMEEFLRRHPPKRTDGLDEDSSSHYSTSLNTDPSASASAISASASARQQREGQPGVVPPTTNLLSGGFEDFMAKLNSLSSATGPASSGTSAPPGSSGWRPSSAKSAGTIDSIDFPSASPPVPCIPLSSLAHDIPPGVESGVRTQGTEGLFQALQGEPKVQPPPEREGVNTLPPRVEIIHHENGSTTKIVVQEKIVYLSCPSCSAGIEQKMQLTPRIVKADNVEEQAPPPAGAFGSRANDEEEDMENQLMSFKSGSNLKSRAASAKSKRASSTVGSTVKRRPTASDQRLIRKASSTSARSVQSTGTAATTESGAEVIVTPVSDGLDPGLSFQKTAQSLVGSPGISRGVQVRIGMVDRGMNTDARDDDLMQAAQVYRDRQEDDDDTASNASSLFRTPKPAGSKTRPATGAKRAGAGTVMGPGGKVRRGVVEPTVVPTHSADAKKQRRPHTAMGTGGMVGGDDDGSKYAEDEVDPLLQEGVGGSGKGGSQATTSAPGKDFLKSGATNNVNRAQAIAQLEDMRRPRTAQSKTAGEAAKAVGLLSGGGVKRPPMLKGGGRRSSSIEDGTENAVHYSREAKDPTLVAEEMRNKLFAYEGHDSQVTQALLAASSTLLPGGRSSPPPIALSPEQRALIEDDSAQTGASPVHKTRVTASHNKTVSPSVPYTTVRPKGPSMGIRGKSPPRTGSPHPRPKSPPNSRQTLM